VRLDVRVMCVWIFECHVCLDVRVLSVFGCSSVVCDFPPSYPPTNSFLHYTCQQAWRAEGLLLKDVGLKHILTS